MTLKSEGLVPDEVHAKVTHADGKIKRKVYEKEMHKLQVELCRLQDWVKETGKRIIILFEGRDAAGKGGTIKAITERVSPRVFRLVALPAPTDRQKTEMFMQRYIERFPGGGEIIIFDRSWYNRAGVEYVMGFCTEAEHQHFLDICPQVEKYIVDAGIQLIKVWLEVGQGCRPSFSNWPASLVAISLRHRRSSAIMRRTAIGH
jgi:polyphosphate kinase 2 (PPK2 family)